LKNLNSRKSCIKNFRYLEVLTPGAETLLLEMWVFGIEKQISVPTAVDHSNIGGVVSGNRVDLFDIKELGSNRYAEYKKYYPESGTWEKGPLPLPFFVKKENVEFVRIGNRLYAIRGGRITEYLEGWIEKTLIYSFKKNRDIGISLYYLPKVERPIIAYC
jgi:hypothetical protein